MRTANLALKFLLELSALAAYGWATFVLVGHPVWSWIVAAAVVLAVVAVWATLLAPNSTRKLPIRARILTELVVFAVAVFVLTLAGAPLLAALLAALVAVSEVLMIRWRQYSEIDRAVARR